MRILAPSKRSRDEHVATVPLEAGDLSAIFESDETNCASFGPLGATLRLIPAGRYRRAHGE